MSRLKPSEHPVKLSLVVPCYNEQEAFAHTSFSSLWLDIDESIELSATNFAGKEICQIYFRRSPSADHSVHP